ncbi:hypothetical protein EWH99_03365 [Sporolactobacillus sp. THM7-7]|nr:hypothetical protein EWH99_03365 [Sporolactobacillus sp. THM7-7]
MLKALRNYGINDIRVDEIDRPKRQPSEALIKVLYSGICGSDLHIYRKGMFVSHLPETMGHEFVGQIEEIEDNDIFEKGDIVVGDPRVPCMHCSACHAEKYNRCEHIGFIGEVTQGCFSEYLSLQINKLLKVNSVKKIKDAALTEPLAVALHVCNQAAFRKSDDVIIFGAGPIGLLTVTLLKSVYPVNRLTVVDLSHNRLRLAKKLGADETFQKAESPNTFDKAVESTGVQACYRDALNVLKSGGSLFIVALYEQKITIDPNPMIEKEMKINGCSTYTFEELKEAERLISNEKVDVAPLITHVTNIEKGKQIFDKLVNQDKKEVKVLFKF